MCLEIFNPFLGLPFTWLGLGLFAVIIALLAARFWFVSPRKGSAHHQSSGFTCPCYAPPIDYSQNKQKM